ncbi:Fic family protein [Nitrosomonas sp.]|uniref:Fic/DOC family protein n=1 Tax=Nitrosomonas sp. TaxID=42353 RepID=UPI00283ABCE1|nr:Fic family protein [Nitrosomonas sp.]MDR4515739.1 Fic family protein [Nitrosomonas sp.]
MSDPYVYPGTNILINKAGLHTQEAFDPFERVMTFARLAEPLPDIPMTYEGYKALHHHIFQDVFPWAGQSRTVALSKGETFFGPPRYVDSEMTKRFHLLEHERHLQHLLPEDFAARAAEHLNEINAIHPFREGNGRTQRLFLEVLAAQAGHAIRGKDIHPEPWNDASIQGFQGNHRPLSALILSGILEQTRSHAQDHGHEQER